MPDHFGYLVCWSVEDQNYLGRCVQFPSMSCLAPTQLEALAGIMNLVAGAPTMGDEWPQDISSPHYDGRLRLQTSPTLHARLTAEASEHGVSLNEWATLKLALDAEPISARRHTHRPQC
jgi:hypothetical protein